MTDPAGSGDGPSRLVQLVEAALAWSYNAALDGLPGTGSLDDFVAGYLRDTGDAERAIDRLVAWQTGKAAAAGFVSGLGGAITLPAAIPANLASVLFIQLRTVAAIAQLRGYDIQGDRVRTLCVACLAGAAVADTLKEVGIKVGTRLTEQALARVAGSALVQVNQRVGFRLVTKAGSTGLLNLGRMVPFIGGVVGGTFDAAMTRAVAQAARSLFVAAPPGGMVIDGEAAVVADPG